MQRREFLGAAAAAALAAGGATTATAAAAGARPYKRIATEEGWISEAVLAANARTNIWITTSGMNYEPQLQMTLQVMGPERVLYAVDYPFEDQGEAVRLLEAMSLNDRQKKLLCEDNARRVFKISST